MKGFIDANELLNKFENKIKEYKARLDYDAECAMQCAVEIVKELLKE